MSDYNVKHTDTTKSPILVEQDSMKDTGTDLVLFGRSFLEYGEQLNENLLRLLENFACPELAASNPVVPDLTATDTLDEPVVGQIWWNTTRECLYEWNGTKWIALASGNDYAANWGQVVHGAAIPRPVGRDGYVFPYSECVWVVSPTGHTGRFDYMVCTAGADAIVNSQYRLLGESALTASSANYLIVGIRGNLSAGTLAITSLPTIPVSPTPSPSPSPTSGSTPTPTPTVTPTISNTPGSTPAATASPTPSSTRPASSSTPTPTPTRTVTPTPTASPISALTVQIVDSARGGNYIDSISLCDLNDYTTVLDTGNIGCTTTFGNCASGKCAPEPGDYVTGDAAVGAAMGITCSGGVPPYTVRFKNFTASAGATEFAASGDCLFIGGSSGFGIGAGTVYTLTIPSNGGSVSGLKIGASCGTGLYALGGNFTVEVKDAVNTTVTNTFPYVVSRDDTGGGTGGGGCFVQGTRLQMANGTVKRVEDLRAGDFVRSYTVPGMIDESAYRWADWFTDSIEGLEYTESHVQSSEPFSEANSITINGEITTTGEHMHFVRHGDGYGWRKASALVVGDALITGVDSELPITSVTVNLGFNIFYRIDVEDVDTLIAVYGEDTPILSHNFKCADCHTGDE